jgi:isopentenyl-diphosphate delta-isomerase
MVEHVVLVDAQDRQVGTMEKMEAHEKGVLHRAFSVFLFDNAGQLIIQQRAWTKYHSPGLWANTCCSHPRENEPIIEAGKRRLKEEMGMDADLRPLFSFIYKADMGNGLIEHELDHVLVGYANTEPYINLQEVASYRSMRLEDIQMDLHRRPERYTEWFKIVFDRFVEATLKTEVA